MHIEIFNDLPFAEGPVAIVKNGNGTAAQSGFCAETSFFFLSSSSLFNFSSSFLAFSSALTLDAFLFCSSASIRFCRCSTVSVRAVPSFLIGITGKFCLAVAVVDASGAKPDFNLSRSISVRSAFLNVTFFEADIPGTDVEELALSRGKADEGAGVGDDMLLIHAMEILTYPFPQPGPKVP